VRPLDPECIQHRHGIRDPERHGVRVRVVGLVAAPDTSVVDVDNAELVGGQRLGDVRLSHLVDRIQESSVEDDCGSVAIVVLEVHALAIQRVSRVRHE